MRRFFDGLAILAITVLGPAGLQADDRQIAQEIVNALQKQEECGTLADFSIDLQVKNGEVQLKGRVAREEDEQLAVEIAQQADGVAVVYNDLEIAPQPAAQSSGTLGLVQKITKSISGSTSEVQLASHRSDADADSRAIAEDIIGRLRTEMKRGNLKGFGVDVAVDSGIVTLQGRVSSEQQRRLALDIARGTPGVSKVLDKLDVTGATATGRGLRGTQPPTPPRELDASDSEANELAQAVVAKLRQQKAKGTLKDFSIDVSVSDGVVWLTGVVTDKNQMNLALDQARYVRGVKAVVNDLKIGNSSELAMTALTQPAAPALLGQNGSGNAQMPMPFAHTQPVNFVPRRVLGLPAGWHRQPAGPCRWPLPAWGWVAECTINRSCQDTRGPATPRIPTTVRSRIRDSTRLKPGRTLVRSIPIRRYRSGWRKVTLEWDDGWWMLDFKSH